MDSQPKKKIQRIRNWTHHITGRIPSRHVVAGREIKPQYKSKPNTENSSKPNTEHRGVYQKKKKKSPILSNTQTKTKPSNPRMVMSLSSSLQLARRRRHRHRSPGRPSSQIVDRRSENADRFASAPVLGARRSVHSSALLQGISLFFSLTLSQSLSFFISLKLKRKWIADRHCRSVITLRLCLCSGERCSLLPPAIRPSLTVFLSDSLSNSQSLSLSHWIKNEMKFINWTSLSLSL